MPKSLLLIYEEVRFGKVFAEDAALQWAAKVVEVKLSKPLEVQTVFMLTRFPLHSRHVPFFVHFKCLKKGSPAASLESDRTAQTLTD